MEIIPLSDQERTVHGIGFNDIILFEPEYKAAYLIWTGVLARVNDVKGSYPAYKGCSIHPDWLRLSVFKAWVDLHFDEGLELDKDLLVTGNRVYGPDTCCFIPKWMNAGIALTKRGVRMPGTALNGSSKKNPFLANISVFAKKFFLGCYPTEQLAHAAWQEAKANAYRLMAERYQEEGGCDDRVTKALNKTASRLDHDRATGVVSWFLSKS